MIRHHSFRMDRDDPPVRLLADDVSGHLVGGIITSIVVALAAGAVVGVAVRLLGRRGSWPAAGVLSVLALIAGPVAVAMISSLIGGFLAGNRLAARRLPS